VTRFFPLFMHLLFRKAYDQINWKRGFVALDKELEALFPRGKSGRKHVDLLFKVWLNDGSEQWVLIHIEIQSQRVEDFELVMYEYHWMMDLPEKLELELRHDIEKIEKEKQVTYLSSMDRAVMALGAKEGRKKGLREGVQKGLREGVQKGLREGVQKGLREGVQKGLQKGRVAGLLEAISVVTDAKFGSAVAKGLIARLENADIDVLKKAQLAVATATSNEQLNHFLFPTAHHPTSRRRTNQK